MSMELLTELFLPCFYAFVACVGFCLLYNIRGFGIVLCSLGGSLGWLAYLLARRAGLDSAMASFLAGMAIAAYAEIMARLRKCPASGYLLLAFFPLVPGAGVYYTMQAYFVGDNERFLAQGRETLGIAGGLAIGVLVVSALVRMINHNIEKRRNRHAAL